MFQDVTHNCKQCMLEVNRGREKYSANICSISTLYLQVVLSCAKNIKFRYNTLDTQLTKSIG